MFLEETSCIWSCTLIKESFISGKRENIGQVHTCPINNSKTNINTNNKKKINKFRNNSIKYTNTTKNITKTNPRTLKLEEINIVMLVFLRFNILKSV